MIFQNHTEHYFQSPNNSLVITRVSKYFFKIEGINSL